MLMEGANTATESLQATTAKIKDSITKVTNSTDKIADTTKSYHDTLISKAAPTTHAQSVDPRTLSNIDHKAKQILMECTDEVLKSRSQLELKDKANEIIASLGKLSLPEGAKVNSALKLQSGEVILQLNSKEAAAWLHIVKVKINFTAAYTENSYFKDRLYTILAPRVPLTFNPGDKAHLWEVEEVNGLTAHSIVKARWIKLDQSTGGVTTRDWRTLRFLSPQLPLLTD
jgi:hypothetical protein